jgi:hypothetical protein
MSDKEEYICCLCGDRCEGYGNNPYPIKLRGRCCNTWDGYVILKRIYEWKKQKEKQHEN